MFGNGRLCWCGACQSLLAQKCSPSGAPLPSWITSGSFTKVFYGDWSRRVLWDSLPGFTGFERGGKSRILPSVFSGSFQWLRSGISRWCCFAQMWQKLLTASYLLPWTLEEGLREQNAPAVLRAAILRELRGLTLDIHIGSHKSSDVVPMARGGGQGGSITPYIWNVELAQILRPLAEKWHAEELFRLHGGAHEVLDDSQTLPPLAVWADNIYILANDIHTIQQRIRELDDAIRNAGKSLKSGSSSLLPSMAAVSLFHESQDSTLWERNLQGLPTVCIHGHKGDDVVDWKTRDKQLGVEVCVDGGFQATWECTYERLRRLWFSRVELYTTRAISLYDRFVAYHSSFLAAALWDSGSWGSLDPISAGRLYTFDMQCCRRIVGLPPPSAGTFLHRLRVCDERIRCLRVKLQLPPPLVMVSVRVHGWMGHAARGSIQSWASLCLGWRDTTWWTETQAIMSSRDPHNKSGWRHHKVGIPPRRHDLWPVASYGLRWKEGAASRETWKQSMPSFTRTLVEGTVPMCAGKKRLRAVLQTQACFRLHS